MTYKAVAKRKASVTDEFTIAGECRRRFQRNGVRSATVPATVVEGHGIKDVHLFANGSRLDAVEARMEKGAVVRLIGTYSQRNVFVIKGMQTDPEAPLHSPGRF